MGELLAGEFDIQRELGRGAYSVVYLVRNNSLDRLEVVKVFDVRLDEGARDLFEQEARIIASLDHKGIPVIYGIEEKEGVIFYRTKYEPSETLEHLIDSEYAGKRIPKKTVLDIMQQIIGVFQYAHEKGVIHRDVKPGNILVNKNGDVRITDFGIAQLIEKAGIQGSDNGQYLGTVSYMAPEQFHGRSDERTDIFSLGIVFYEMLTGINPFEKESGETISDVKRKIIERGVGFPIEVSLDKRLKGIVMKALAKNPDDRFQNSQEFNGAVGSYRMGITRRKWLGIVIGGGVGYGLARLGINHLEYLESIDSVVDQIRKTSTDSDKIDSLFSELNFRLFDQKIRLWDTTIPEGRFPYGTADDGSWLSIEREFSTNGCLSGIDARGFEVTKNRFFRELFTKRLEDIVITKRDKDEPATALRFFYSYARAYDALLSRGIEIDEYKRKAIEALDLIVENFNEGAEVIPIFPNNPNECEAGMMTLIPFLCWGYENTGDKKYLETAKRHVYTSIQVNIREDGSVRKTAIFSLDDGRYNVVGERNSKGLDDSSTLARAQAQMLLGLAELYKSTADEHVLKAAEKIADYSLDKLNSTEDYIPYFDFDAPHNPNMPRDSSAAAIFLTAFTSLFSATKNKRYRDAYRKIKKSLVVNYLSADLGNYSGLLKGGCDNWREKEYIGNSLIIGDYHFLMN